MPKMDANPLLTIVICTRNRAVILEECLQSLGEQTASPKLFSILVVDNASHDGTKVMVRQQMAIHRHLSYIEETVIGLSIAKNTGYHSATTPWVGYLDDDAKVDPHFIERALWIIEQYGYVCFGGRYLPWYRYGRKKWVRDEWFTKERLLEKMGELKDGFLSGGVFFIKRNTLESAGGFRPNLGMKGPSVGYGEEEALQIQLRRQGIPIHFDPELIIHHCVMPHKLQMKWHFKSAYAKGKSWILNTSTPLVVVLLHSIWSGLGLLVKRIPIALFQLISDQNYHWQNAALATIKPIFYYAGALRQKSSELLTKTGKDEHPI